VESLGFLYSDKGVPYVEDEWMSDSNGYELIKDASIFKPLFLARIKELILVSTV